MRQSQWTPAPPVGTAASRAPSIPSARYARAAVRVVEGAEMLSDVVMDIVAREQIGDLASLELQHPQCLRSGRHNRSCAYLVY